MLTGSSDVGAPGKCRSKAMFLIDTYRPVLVSGDDMRFHRDLLDRLRILCAGGSVPHVVFYGPKGGGKRTLIGLFLKLLYGDNVGKLKEVELKVRGGGGGEVSVVVKQSNHHIEIEPCRNNFDRYIVKEVVKQYAVRVPLSVLSKDRKFKVILVNNADHLSYYAQMALRRMMEVYSGTCRFVLWCETLGKIIEPLVSRCSVIRVPAPSDDEVSNLLSEVAEKEEIDMSAQSLLEAVELANGNVRKAMWYLEAMRHGVRVDSSYESDVRKIIEKVWHMKTESVVAMRKLFYGIIVSGVESTDVIRDVTRGILKSGRVDTDSAREIVAVASEYTHNMVRCRREVLHFEAFVQAVMEILWRRGTIG